jgi:hypothetical protein
MKVIAMAASGIPIRLRDEGVLPSATHAAGHTAAACVRLLWPAPPDEMATEARKKSHQLHEQHGAYYTYIHEISEPAVYPDGPYWDMIAFFDAEEKAEDFAKWILGQGPGER